MGSRTFTQNLTYSPVLPDILEYRWRWGNLSGDAQAELAAESEKAITSSGGRPRDKVDEWAREQVHGLGRDRAEVYSEWETKIGSERADALANSRDSFNYMIKSPPKKK